MTIIPKPKRLKLNTDNEMLHATENAIDEYVHCDVYNIVWDRKNEYVWGLVFKNMREAIDDVMYNVK